MTTPTTDLDRARRPLEDDGRPVHRAVVEALRAAGVDVEDGARRIAEYSYDASNYRVPPLAVAFPRTPAQVRDAVRACAAHGIPLLPRGGGTGQAGGALGPGVVLDLSRHLTAVGHLDPEARTVDVQPGVVLSHLTDEVRARTGGVLTFAPDPSSRTRATVGGSVANDACGNHSVRYGRMGDHVVELDLVMADGAMVTVCRAPAGEDAASSPPAVRATGDDEHSRLAAARIEAGLREIASGSLALLRQELGRIPRQVSGYHLEHLLPERGFDVAKALVGSEGTLGIVVGARLGLVEAPPATVLLCLGYRNVVDAATDVPLLLEHDPAAIEGIDDAIVATMRHRRGDDAVTALPDGAAWLYVELDGEDPEDLAARATRLLDQVRSAGHAVDGRVVTDPVETATLWRVREEGAGLSSRLAPEVARGREEATTGWEDSAVAPERLAGYLRDLLDLLEAHGLAGVMYGHFGAGCMHVRITFDLRTPEGVATFDRFIHEAAELVVAHGGSLSGEHGDGRARSALLPIMYSPEMLAVFAAVKHLLDPDSLLVPHTIVDPLPLTQDLALTDVPARAWGSSLAAIPPQDDGRLPATDDTTLPARTEPGLDPFVAAAQACIGVGKCRTTSGGVMCPSYRATRDEKDSTRGRARVLQEMVRTSPDVRTGWASDEVADSLDLCLSCKACSTDCPTGVDMATLKSEVLHHRYAGRPRPLPHYSLGRLPQWLGPLTRAHRVVNALARTPLARVGMRLAGLTTARPLPHVAGPDDWAYAAARAGARRPGSGDGQVLLLVDTFTRAFRPQVAGSAAAVLGAAGEVVECTQDVCCGLTYITTGQLDQARRTLERALKTLDDGTGRPIVVTEPSCASALRHDLPRLVPTGPARSVAGRVSSFAHHVRGLGTQGRLAVPDDLPDQVVVQTHCHEYATWGPTTQRAALAAAGVDEVIEATGCCGVAGNFGFEAEHYSISVAVADHALRPALEATAGSGVDGACGDGDNDGAGAIPVLTDGFSCHQQVAHLAPDRPGLHLAELLDPRPGTARPHPRPTDPEGRP